MYRTLAVRAAAAGAVAASAFSMSSGVAQADALSPQEFRKFQLIGKKQISPDTAQYTLAFPAEHRSEPLGLTTASCLVSKATIGGKDVVRPYTPVSAENMVGRLELVVKSYPEGNMSKHFAEMKFGEYIDLKGPFQKFEYKANEHKYIGMVAGGTGITPMLQVIEKILANPRDKTEVRLIFANKTEADILFKNKLDALAWKYPNFKVVYTLDESDDSWTGYKGHVNADMVRAVLPPPTAGTRILVCGPPGMMKAISGPKGKDYSQGEIGGVLKATGYTMEHVYKY